MVLNTSGTGTRYAPGDTGPTLTSDNVRAILYAKWQERPKYTYYYNYMKNTSDTVTNMPENQIIASYATTYQFVIRGNVPVRDGYVFQGWNSNASGTGNWYEAGYNGPTLTSDNTGALLYAIWREREMPTIPQANIVITNATTNSLTVSATITNVLTRSDGWYLCLCEDTSFSSYTSYQGSGSSVTHTFTGLRANTVYYFKILNIYDGLQSWQADYAYGSTLGSGFRWDNNDNIHRRRPTSTEWRRLVAFIENKFQTTVTAESKNTIGLNKTLSARLFNELAQKVGLAETVGKGTPIRETLLNALKNKANS